MLKITVQETDQGRTTVLLTGQVSGRWVAELRRSCDSLLAQGGSLTLDLEEVSFIDREGCGFLRHLQQHHVTFVHCSPFVVEQLRGEMMTTINDQTKNPRAKVARASRVSVHTPPVQIDVRADQEEPTLVEGLQRGDQHYYEQFVRQYAGMMLAVARRLLGNEEEARTAVQNAFHLLPRRLCWTR
jgi:anti-anti-sigma regulatory factor